MRRVVIESPFKGATKEDELANVAYAKACMLDSLRRGEAPFASHLLYTQVLDDSVPEDRELGIAAGFAFGVDVDASVFYVDRGVSEGMLRGAEAAGFADRSYEVRAADDAQGRAEAAAADLPLRAAWKRGYKTRALDDSIVHRGGWKCAAMHDPSGRRGIWYQERGDILAVQGGREGEFEAQIPIDRREHNLLTILSTSRWMIDDHGTRKGADVLAESVEP